MKERSGRPPRMRRARSRISSAALFVKVTETIERGSAPVSTSRARRCVMTRVLPEPAPARTRRGPFCVEDRLLLLGIQPLE